MTNKEAINIIEFVLGRGEEADRFGLRNEGITVYHDISEEREALDLAIKALKILSTVTEAKFHDMSDSPMLQYKKGWNDALDAVKIKFESEEEYEL